MATRARRAQGTLLKIGDGATSGEAFTPIAELTSIQTSMEADDLDASNHDTPSAWKEFIPGMKEGTIDIEGNFIPGDASQIALHNAFIDGLVHNFQLIYPTDPLYQMHVAATVLELSVDAPADEKLSFSTTIKFAGAPIFV
jgi:TP901-1 family phage major tail protein